MKSNKQLFATLTCIAVLCLSSVFATIELSFSNELVDYELIYLYFNGYENGLYVNIGAVHPVHQSCTRFLRSRGWSGINTDFDPAVTSMFYATNKGDLTLNVAVTGRNHNIVQVSTDKLDPTQHRFTPIQ